MRSARNAAKGANGAGRPHGSLTEASRKPHGFFWKPYGTLTETSRNPYCVGRCWIQLLRCPSQLIFIAYPHCTLIAYLYWIEGRCRPVIQISLAYLCWIEGPCRPVIQIFIADLYCIMSAYLRRGGLIGQAS